MKAFVLLPCILDKMLPFLPNSLLAREKNTGNAKILLCFNEPEDAQSARCRNEMKHCQDVLALYWMSGSSAVEYASL